MRNTNRVGGNHHRAWKGTPQLQNTKIWLLILNHFLINLVSTNTSFPHCRGEVRGPRSSGWYWDREENTGRQQKEETKDESSEVVFTCHCNVGQSPMEDPEIAMGCIRLHWFNQINRNCLSTDLRSVNTAQFLAGAQFIDLQQDQRDVHSMSGLDNRPVCIYWVGHVCAQSSQEKLSYPLSIVAEHLETDKRRDTGRLQSFCSFF